MSTSIRREIFDKAQGNESLTYYDEAALKPINISEELESRVNKTGVSYSYTIAIGKNAGLTDNTYQYPIAIFTGSSSIPGGKKQIYPPIVNTTFSMIYGNINTNGAFTISNNYSFSGIYTKTYLFPRIFHITYSSSQQNPSSYSHTYIPSFNPYTQSNNNQFAYFSGSTIYIKDPVFTKKIPTLGYIFGSTWPSTYYTYFKVELNETVCENLRYAYQTSSYPLSYSKVISNVPVLRRQTEDIDSFNALQTIYQQATGTTNELYIYYKGQRLTSQQQLAYIMPKYGRGSQTNPQYQDGLHFLAGSDPSYFIGSTTARPSSESGNFVWSHALPQSQFNDGGPLQYCPYKKFFSNMFLIKVNGNENMNAFGQSSKYYNHGSYILPYTNVFANVSQVVFDPISSTIGCKTVNGMQNIDFPSNPEWIYSCTHQSEPCVLESSSWYILDNYYKGNSDGFYFCPSVSVSSLSSLSFLRITYTTYNYAKTHTDVTNIGYYVSNNNTKLHIKLDFTASSNQLHTMSATNSSIPVNSYAYCYLAADYFRVMSNGAFIYDRVLSDSYLCIKKVAVSNSQQMSSMYRVFYTENVVDD